MSVCLWFEYIAMLRGWIDFMGLKYLPETKFKSKKHEITFSSNLNNVWAHRVGVDYRQALWAYQQLSLGTLRNLTILMTKRYVSNDEHDFNLIITLNTLIPFELK